MWSNRGFRLVPHSDDDCGQALALVVACIALLILIPLAVQGLATGLASTSTQATLNQQALQAARAGLSDYINHVTTDPSYLQYCSTGTFSCQSGQSDDSSNPAFSTSASSLRWAGVQNASFISNEAYSYLVDTHAVSTECATAPQTFPVYVTGRAGSSGHYMYQELEANLSVSNAAWACNQVISSESYGSCSDNGYSVTVPTGAAYAVVSLYGAQGGGHGDQAGGGGDGYEIYDAYVPAVVGEIWTVSVGEAGGGGTFEVISLGEYGVGGRSCLGSQNMGGGNSGGAALLELLSDNGGAGGGATGICVDGSGDSECTSSSSQCAWSSGAFTSTPCVLAVASGGGGDGGTCILVCSNLGGTGGYNASTTPAGDGANGSGLDGGSGGLVGGNSQPVGAAGGSSLAGVDSGYGGGGGGGFPDGGGSGAAGGLCVLQVCTAGAGGGGGAGNVPSTPPKPYANCPSPSTMGWVTSYPVPGGASGSDNGLASITFYSGGGTTCNGSQINVTSVSSVDIQPVPTGTT